MKIRTGPTDFSFWPQPLSALSHHSPGEAGVSDPGRRDYRTPPRAVTNCYNLLHGSKALGPPIG